MIKKIKTRTLFSLGGTLRGKGSQRNQTSSGPGGDQTHYRGVQFCPSLTQPSGFKYSPILQMHTSRLRGSQGLPIEGMWFKPLHLQVLHAENPPAHPLNRLTRRPQSLGTSPPTRPDPSLSMFQLHGRLLLYPQSPLQCLKHSRHLLRCGSAKGILP